MSRARPFPSGCQERLDNAPAGARSAGGGAASPLLTANPASIEPMPRPVRDLLLSHYLRLAVPAQATDSPPLYGARTGPSFSASFQWRTVAAKPQSKPNRQRCLTLPTRPGTSRFLSRKLETCHKPKNFTAKTAKIAKARQLSSPRRRCRTEIFRLASPSFSGSAL